MEKRAQALDALRGLAIIGMILSGQIPFSGPAALPAWMYHAQMPPPDHLFRPDLPSITWVDLVFPFFLFAMGAAFPFALRKRLEAGVPLWKLALQAGQRGAMLALFALILQHSKPHLLSAAPERLHWLIALAGFLFLFLIYYRYPPRFPLWTVQTLKIAAVLAALLLFSRLEYLKGGSLELGRSDIIIIVLANTALFGTLIWLATRDRPLLRCGVLALLLGFRLTHTIEGSWTALLWEATPAPELYRFYFLQYLFIVLPGTLIGDLYYRWLKSPQTDQAPAGMRAPLLATLCLLLILCNLYGLFTRQLMLNLAGNGLLLSAIYLIVKRPYGLRAAMLQQWAGWGGFWLLLGLVLESLEGGIKKDPSTLAYYLVTAGLACFALIALSIAADSGRPSKGLRLLIENGCNPMIAYVAAGHLVMPLLAFTSLSAMLNRMLIHPGLGLLKGVIVTLLAALATAFLTRRNIFWRS